MANLQVEVDDDDVIALLNRLRNQLIPVRVDQFLANRPLRFLRSRVESRFAFEGDDVVGKWQQLRYSTRAIRQSQGFPPAHPINVRTGALYQLARTARVQKQTLTMPGRKPSGDLLSKLRVAQMGGSGGLASMRLRRMIGPQIPAPPRPVLGLGSYDEKIITSQLHEWIMQAGKP